MARLTETSYNLDNEIFAATAGLRSPVHVLIDATKCQANADNLKPLLPGTFISGTNDAARPLPRTKISTTAVTASSTTVITVEDASFFVPTDVLRILPPSAEIALTGTWAEADTLTVTVGGVSASYVLDAGDTTRAIAVASAAAAFNADSSLSKMATFLAAGDSLFLYADDFITPYSIAESVVTAGDGDAAVQDSQTVLVPNKTIGTIDTDGVSDANNQITIASAAAYDVPIGMPVGVVSTPLGMLGSGIDLTFDAPEQGLYTSGSVYGDRLPYWDGELKRLFPEITLV